MSKSRSLYFQQNIWKNVCIKKIAVIKLILLFLSPFCEVELFYPFKNYTYSEYLFLCAFLEVI